MAMQTEGLMPAIRVRNRQKAKRGPAAKATTNGSQPGPDNSLPPLLDALQAMRSGDFSVRLPRDQTGLAGKIADTFNDIIASNERMAQQLEQVGQVVGRDGRTRKRVKFGDGH